MADNGFSRGDGVIALGGGVIGDLAGTVASLYMRGIAFIQVATSMTAMVDSSVGGKTAVNLGNIKNIIGSFYQPDLVLIDPLFLNSLSKRNLTEGIRRGYQVFCTLRRRFLPVDRRHQKF
jgi:3-dehydroquinate synthetase